MSWDVSVFGGSERPRLDDSSWFDDMPVIGTLEEVRQRISNALPEVGWCDPTWGQYCGDGFTFELNLAGENETGLVKHFVVHVRGGGDAIADLLRFSVPNGWHLVDWSTGELIDPTAPSDAGWKGWQSFADKIRQQNSSSDKV